jgi:hypothetical protein
MSSDCGKKGNVQNKEPARPSAAFCSVTPAAAAAAEFHPLPPSSRWIQKASNAAVIGKIIKVKVDPNTGQSHHHLHPYM